MRVKKSSKRPVLRYSGEKHYKERGGIEPIEFIRSNSLNFIEGNIVKYIHRYKYSDTPVKDIEDLINYAEMLLEDFNEQKTSRS